MGHGEGYRGGPVSDYLGKLWWISARVVYGQVFRLRLLIILSEGALDKITLITWGVFILSMIMFYWFGKLTINLIRQHQDVYGLLAAIEEEEKKK